MNSGLDPEILAICDGRIIAGERFVPAPMRDAQGVLNPLSYDNAAVEMRPMHNSSARKLVKSCLQLMYNAKRHLADAIKDGRVPAMSQLSMAPAGVLADGDQVLPSVMGFGCSPSHMVMPDYSSIQTVPYVSASETPIRSAGFHIHCEIENPEAAQAVVAVLDCILGLRDVMGNTKAGFAAQSRMRRMELGYGRAGEYRMRIVASGAHVLEYRAMSPWILANPLGMVWSINVMRHICSMPTSDVISLLSKMPNRSSVMDVINECSYSESQSMLSAISPHINRGLVYA